MLSDGKCLYVGRLALRKTDHRDQIRSCFAEFGPIQQVRCFTERGCAEFAYAAMMDQALGAENLPLLQHYCPLSVSYCLPGKSN